MTQDQNSFPSHLKGVTHSSVARLARGFSWHLSASSGHSPSSPHYPPPQLNQRHIGLGSTAVNYFLAERRSRRGRPPSNDIFSPSSKFPLLLCRKGLPLYRLVVSRSPTQDPNSSAKIRRRRISSARWPRDQTGTHTLCRCSDHTCDDARSIIAIDAEHCWNINQHHAIDQRSVLCTLTLKSREPRIESPCPVDMLFTVADWPYLPRFDGISGRRSRDRQSILEIDTGD